MEKNENNFTHMSGGFDPQNSKFIELKLDTSNIYHQIEVFLSGLKTAVFIDEETGQQITKAQRIGKPLCNEKGLQRILGMVSTVANNHSVQGNLSRDRQFEILADLRVTVMRELVSNCYVWEINDSDLDPIIDHLMTFFELFISRTVDNLERESHNMQFSTREVYSQNSPQKRSAMRSFFGKSGDEGYN